MRKRGMIRSNPGKFDIENQQTNHVLDPICSVHLDTINPALYHVNPAHPDTIVEYSSRALFRDLYYPVE